MNIIIKYVQRKEGNLIIETIGDTPTFRLKKGKFYEGRKLVKEIEQEAYLTDRLEAYVRMLRYDANKIENILNEGNL